MTSTRTGVLILACTTLLGACMSENEYRAKGEEQTRRRIARSQNAFAAKRGQLSDREKRLANKANSIGSRFAAGERAERLTKAEEPFVRMSGYVVRGSDESSFMKCGDPGVHYTRMSAGAVALIVQRYRFKASRPLAAVYFTINGRIIKDTITVGENSYTSVVEIERVYPEVPDERPACAAPPRGSLIDTVHVKRR